MYRYIQCFEYEIKIIIIDEKINWTHHISYIKNKISKGFGIILRARKLFTKSTLLKLYNSFVLPYLIYCVEIWGNASETTEPLQENSDAEDNQEQKSTVDEKLPRPRPRRKLTLKKSETAGPPKPTIISMFQAMKWHEITGNDADLSRENLKVQRGDTSKS